MRRRRDHAASLGDESVCSLATNEALGITDLTRKADRQTLSKGAVSRQLVFEAESIETKTQNARLQW